MCIILAFAIESLSGVTSSLSETTIEYVLNQYFVPTLTGCDPWSGLEWELLVFTFIL